MPDQRSVMKEYRSLDEKRIAKRLTPEESARLARLRDLLGPDATVAAGAGDLMPGFDVSAAAEQLRESLLPAGLRNRPESWNPLRPWESAPAQSAAPAPTAFHPDGGHRPSAPAFDAGAAGYDPGSAAYPTAAGYGPSAAGYDPSAAGYDPNTAGYDPSAAGYDPSAAGNAFGAAEYDPSAPVSDPAPAGWDPNQPWDPDAAAAFSAATQDPNASADPAWPSYGHHGASAEVGASPPSFEASGVAFDAVLAAALPFDAEAASAIPPGEVPDSYEATLGEYDDSAGFAAPVAELPAPDGELAPGAQPAEASSHGEDDRFQLESGGSFLATAHAAAPEWASAVPAPPWVAASAAPAGEPLSAAAGFEIAPTAAAEVFGSTSDRSREGAPPAAAQNDAPLDFNIETEAAEAVAAPAPERSRSVLQGLHRVVMHTVDGQVKRGVLEDADLGAATLMLAAQPGGTPEGVATESVKAIFFALSPGETAPVGEGMPIRVTFQDGRQVAGFSTGHDEGGAGFFMTPADTRTSTGRIWVYRAAVREVAPG